MIPLGSERDAGRPARVVTALILLNVLAYLLMRSGMVGDGPDGPIRAFIDATAFRPSAPRWWTLLTYQFVHDPGSWLHLGGNMLFLWVFGRPIEGHVGPLRFLVLYLSGGVLAGLAHAATSPSPVIGASGAVAAVSGAFLALFPRSRIFVFFPLMGIVAVPATVLIAIYVALDLFGFLGAGRGGVAHAAHLAGYAWGLGLGLLSLRFGGAPRGDTDLVFLLRQAARRRAMRKAMREGNAWLGNAGRRAVAVAAGPLEGPMREIAEVRARVQAALRTGDGATAATEWRTLRALDPAARLPSAAQLDLANRMYAGGDPEAALEAYEAFLAGPVGNAEADPVRLLAASLRLRHGGDRSAAAAHLRGLAERLDDPEQRRLAAALLAEASA